MFKYSPVVYCENVYLTDDKLAEAFGLSKKLIRALIKQVNPNAPVLQGHILVSELTFRKLNFPFCRNWLHVVYSYARQKYLLRQSLHDVCFGNNYYDERIGYYG